MIEDAPVIICGFPSPAEDYREDFLDFNSYLGCNDRQCMLSVPVATT